MEVIAIKVNDARRSIWHFTIKSALPEKKKNDFTNVLLICNVFFCSTNMASKEIMRENNLINNPSALLF